MEPSSAHTAISAITLPILYFYLVSGFKCFTAKIGDEKFLDSCLIGRVRCWASCFNFEQNTWNGHLLGSYRVCFSGIWSLDSIDYSFKDDLDCSHLSALCIACWSTQCISLSLTAYYLRVKRPATFCFSSHFSINTASTCLFDSYGRKDPSYCLISSSSSKSSNSMTSGDIIPVYFSRLFVINYFWSWL